jgi:hypothetical protein
MRHTLDRTRRTVWPFSALACCAALSGALLLSGGCGVLGVIAHAAPQYQNAVYSGLAGHSTGVMVWADRGVRVDWSTIQVDLARNIQDLLQKSDAKELKGTTWPVQPGSIARYQMDHPGIEATPITDVAPKLGVQRLIYIEIESFSTRSEMSLQMYRGSATMTLKIIEVEGNQSKIAYEESNIRAFFPEKGPPEGVLNATDVVMYRGTVVTMARQIVDRLATHMID